MLSQILFGISAADEVGIATGALARYGTLIKNVASGQIVSHVQESSIAHALIGKGLLGLTSPAGLAVSAVSKVLSLGTGIYNSVQLNQLKRMVEGLRALQIATLGVSLVGVGVSAAGFLYMRQRFNAVDEKIDKLLDTVIQGLEIQQKANIRSHLSQAAGLVQQANQAHSLNSPQREYSRIAECLAGEAAHFEGELKFVVNMSGKVNHELFWQLAQALMVCNSVRIDCRIRTNELRNALTVALGVAESYEGLFGRLTPLSFDIPAAQSAKTLTALKDVTDGAATKPYLIDYLHSQRIDGPSYLGQLELEEKHPLLMLKVV